MKPSAVERRPGPWRICEFFTIAALMSMVATSMPREAFEPVSHVGGWDFETPAGRDNLRGYIGQMGPDFIFIACPKGPWSQAPRLQNPHQCRMAQQEQQTGYDLLVFLEELIHFQIGRTRVVAGVNLAPSRVWTQPPWKAACDRPDMSEAVLGMGTSRTT